MAQANANLLVVLAQTVTSPGTAVQLASHPVIDGLDVVVTARVTNTGSMYVGTSAANAQSGPREVFGFGRSASYKIDNTSRLFVDADVSSDVLEVRIPKEEAPS